MRSPLARLLAIGLVSASCALPSGAIGPVAAQPQSYPTRTITFVVPFAPAG